MAMLGLRDISSLSTPPMDRRAIVTEVIPYDRERIRRALIRELSRDGQVFFVHNRVYNIQSVADEIQKLVPDARIVSVDPLCHVVAPHGPHPTAHAADFNRRAVFEAWDMIAGRTLPELGGSRAHLDIVGVNYYWTNQWEIGNEQQPLAFDDPRRVPLSKLLRSVWKRYGGDVLVTETAHVDDMRPIWLHSLADTCEELIRAGIPLRGTCLYPILGMPEWHDRSTWTRMGLWDIAVPTLERLIYEPMRDALAYAQRLERHFNRAWRSRDASVAEPSGESVQ
jgi:hypothetical protein